MSLVVTVVGFHNKYFCKLVLLIKISEKQLKDLVINCDSSKTRNKELYSLTGMETRQLFRHVFVTLNNFKEVFYST